MTAAVGLPQRPGDDWRESYVMAGVRVILKKALKEVGGYWTGIDTVESLLEQARRKLAPVEETVDQWAALALNGTMPSETLGFGRRVITREESEMVNAQAKRALELYRAETGRGLA